METKIEINATLMNKTNPVIRFKGFLKIGAPGIYGLDFTDIDILDEKRSPILINTNFSKERNIENLNYWIKKRFFSPRRKIPHTLKIEYEDAYPHLFSMSDQYWIRYSDEEKWEDFNYFTNKANDNFGRYLFSHNKYVQRIRIPHDAPELTTNGIQNKRWVLKMADNELGNMYALHKRSSKELGTEVYADVIVSNLLKKIQIMNFAECTLVIDSSEVASECMNFISQNTELVPASHLLLVTPKSNNEDVYDALIKAGDIYGIPDVKDFLNSMIYVDALVNNEDRNTGNIGFIRDDEGNFLSCAPLYDFGFSFLKEKEDTAVKGIFSARRKQLIQDKIIDKPDRQILRTEIKDLEGPGTDRVKKLIEIRAKEAPEKYKW